MKEFTITQSDAFRLRVKSWKCVNPTDLNAMEFIQESLNDKGEVSVSSTYQFFMTDAEIKTLAKELAE